MAKDRDRSAETGRLPKCGGPYWSADFIDKSCAGCNPNCKGKGNAFCGEGLLVRKSCHIKKGSKNSKPLGGEDAFGNGK